MDDIVVQYRGISRELVAGDALVVESCEAGVLRLRRAPAVKPTVVHLDAGMEFKADEKPRKAAVSKTSTPTASSDPKGSTDA